MPNHWSSPPCRFRAARATPCTSLPSTAACTRSTPTPPRGYQFSQARLVTPPTWTTPNTFPYPGASPSISANGLSNGIVWAAANANPSILYAYDASDLHQLYNSNQAAGGRDQFGAGNKFMTPAIANGKVYVGTTNGVGVFGILPSQPPSQPPAITSSSTASGRVHKSFSYQITATNSPTSYIATGLPAGLSVNTSTGRISGTPRDIGTTIGTIFATNAAGRAASS